MGRDEIQQEIDRLTKKLEEYPHGTLTYKTIKGKKQPYLQWTENGRTKSRYIKVDERTAVIGEIEERRAVGERLHRLREYYDRIRDILAENPYLVNQRMAIGEQTYESLILSRSFYVDKTYFIPAWWERGAVHTLITRPRRFGKTLTLSMTECFFSTRYKGREELFRDLQIWRDPEYRRLQGTWPVVFLSFASVKDKDYQGAVKSISDSLAYLYRQHTDILEGDVLSEEEKERFLQTEKSLLQQDEDVCIRALKHLSGFLNAFYKRRVIILIDEYDTPMIEGYTNGYLKEITDFMRRFFNQSLKTNPFLQKSLLTGITRIAHESLFSDMNNLQVVSYSSGYYADVFGFTETEVFQALDCRNMDLISKHETDRMETEDEKRAVKSWYDGFTFGGKTDIYNPWSITCYLNERTFQPFWVNTGGYRMISDLILNGEDEIKDDLQILIAGGSIRKTFFEQVDFQELEYDTDAVWPFLLAAGYLRADHVQILGETTADLSITNRETQLMFRHMVRKWFQEARSGREYHGFCKSLLEGDLAMMNRQINELTLKMISFFDTGVHPSANAPERFYHGFVLGLVVDLEEDYEIISNRESGYGRYDVMMRPRREGLDGILMEFKVFDEMQEDCLEDTVRAALDQIDRKCYEETLIDTGIPKEKIRKYGFAFQGKKVLIGKEQKKINEQCLQMEPAVRPLLSVAEKEGKFFVSAEIPGIDIADRPCFYKGTGRVKGSFIRVGDSDEPMTEYEVYSYEAFRKKYQDDIRVVPRATMGVLDRDRLEDYIRRLKQEKPNLASLSDEMIYELMSITREGQVTLSALLLFCRYPQVYFPQLCITAVVLPGDEVGELGESGERFLDNQRIEGSIPEMLDQAIAFVRKNMRTKTIIHPDTGKREDRTDYPITAIREALLNTLVHRDYSMHTEGMPIQILMFPDRIEIRNPGGIYGRLKIDQLGKVQPDTRNPVLATALEIMGITENRYSGIPTIRRTMHEYGLREPEFLDQRGSFAVILFNTAQKGIPIRHSKLTDKEESLLAFLETPRSRKELVEHLGLSSSVYAIQTYVMPLVERGLVRMTIPEKPGSRNQRFYRG